MFADVNLRRKAHRKRFICFQKEKKEFVFRVVGIVEVAGILVDGFAGSFASNGKR